MKINNPRFVTSVFKPGKYPTDIKPEIAFSGRSNVGKSSLLNMILNEKKLAKISSKPGRTQSINFFNIDDKFYFVDLPGYGFARVPDKVKEEWGRLINDYLFNRPNLIGIIQIVDARHDPTKDDIMMIDWLKTSGLPVMLVATKVDKIGKSKRAKQQKNIINKLDLPEEFYFSFVSSKTTEGKGKILQFLQEVLNSSRIK